MATRKKKNNIGAFGHPIYGNGFAKYGEMRPNDSSEIPNNHLQVEFEPAPGFDSGSVSVYHEGLDEAAKNYALNTAEDSEQYSARYLGYKDGAKWQKEQDDKELSEKIAAAYQLGLADKEKQMLKEAVEGEVCGRVYDYINVRFADCICKFLEPKNISYVPADVSKYKVGDKVRIIIVKED